jgi:hypothetical protein
MMLQWNLPFSFSLHPIHWLQSEYYEIRDQTTSSCLSEGIGRDDEQAGFVSPSSVRCGRFAARWRRALSRLLFPRRQPGRR